MAAIPQSTILPKAIGLIAGNGLFPQLFARAAKARGVEVVAVAMLFSAAASAGVPTQPLVAIKD